MTVTLEENVNSTLARAKLCDAELWELLDGLETGADHRTAVGLALLHLSREHHSSVIILINSGLAGSAFALLRPQMESFLRGLWHYHCATDRQIANFLSGKEPPKKSVMIKALKNVWIYKSLLEIIENLVWKEFCDYTHGGMIQTKARVVGGEVLQNFLPQHVTAVISASATLSMFSSYAMTMIVDKRDIGRKGEEIYLAHFGTAES